MADLTLGLKKKPGSELGFSTARAFNHLGPNRHWAPVNSLRIQDLATTGVLLLNQSLVFQRVRELSNDRFPPRNFSNFAEHQPFTPPLHDYRTALNIPVGQIFSLKEYSRATKG